MGETLRPDLRFNASDSLSSCLAAIPRSVMMPYPIPRLIRPRVQAKVAGSKYNRYMTLTLPLVNLVLGRDYWPRTCLFGSTLTRHHLVSSAPFFSWHLNSNSQREVVMAPGMTAGAKGNSVASGSTSKGATTPTQNIDIYRPLANQVTVSLCYILLVGVYSIIRADHIETTSSSPADYLAPSYNLPPRLETNSIHPKSTEQSLELHSGQTSSDR